MRKFFLPPKFVKIISAHIVDHSVLDNFSITVKFDITLIAVPSSVMNLFKKDFVTVFQCNFCMSVAIDASRCHEALLKLFLGQFVERYFLFGPLV
jgi:hypothetical protein